MDIWKSLSGILLVELTSPEPERTLGAINDAGIQLFQIQQIDLLTCRFLVQRRDYQALERLCQKKGSSLKILKRQGLYYSGLRLLKRPVLVLGMGLLLFLVLYLPTRVLFIQVTGNCQVPAKEILAAAEKNGIVFGASRREVRSEKVKNGLLGDVPQLQWAGVNTSGCVAIISVRERREAEPAEPEFQVSSIVADRDGYILSGTVVRGTPLFQVGQAVTKGQTLISGYTDCGICIRAARAEGEIIAQTSRNQTAIMPSSHWIRRGRPVQRKKYSLLFGKKRINLQKDSGNLPIGCGRIYEEYYVTLPGGFRLPAALCVETVTTWSVAEADVDPEATEVELSAFLRNYLLQQMMAGEVLTGAEQFSSQDGVYRLEGSFLCREFIGRVRQEQIGETNGEIG